MGNANGGGPEPFRRETIESASYHTRNVQSSSGSGGSGSSGCLTGKHDGVVVNTKEGNSYLIDHPGGNHIATVQKASNMSKNWTKTHDIPVKGDKTVQEVFNAASGRTTNPVVNYITAGTCIGTAKSAEKALKK